jgi:hypothetical protein
MSSGSCARRVSVEVEGDGTPAVPHYHAFASIQPDVEASQGRLLIPLRDLHSAFATSMIVVQSLGFTTLHKAPQCRCKCTP